MEALIIELNDIAERVGATVVEVWCTCRYKADRGRCGYRNCEEAERCPVIGQIEVALPQRDNITSPETGLTSRWCSNSRPFVEPMKEAMQMTAAQAAGAAPPTRPMDFPSPCELAANQYRVGFICC